MATIFVSYSRHSEAVAASLVQDVEALGHAVWFDQELTGGQTWWDQILAKIRTCDLFLFVLDPASLESVACVREYTYAAQLGKTILPVLVSEGVSVGLLPDELSRVQYVDVRQGDRAATLRLARALTGVPPAGPLPNPLPPPPEVPLSYLASVGRLVDGSGSLTYEQQSAILLDLRKALRESATRDDARVLMERLRRRRDLLAAIADEMQELKAELQPRAPDSIAPDPPRVEESRTVAASVPTIDVTDLGRNIPPISVPPPRMETTIDVSYSLLGRAGIGAIVGFIAGVLLTQTVRDLPWQFGLITAAAAAFVAAIAGRRPRVVVVALVCAVLVWVGSLMLLSATGGVLRDTAALAALFLFGAPGAALSAAVVWWKDRRRRRKEMATGNAQPV